MGQVWADWGILCCFMRFGVLVVVVSLLGSLSFDVDTGAGSGVGGFGSVFLGAVGAGINGPASCRHRFEARARHWAAPGFLILFPILRGGLRCLLSWCVVPVVAT